jgi:hypothetical protein
MLEGGASIHQIGDIQGWSASQLVLMIRKYSHFATEQHRSAIELIDLQLENTQSPPISPPPTTLGSIKPS